MYIFSVGFAPNFNAAAIASSMSVISLKASNASLLDKYSTAVCISSGCCPKDFPSVVSYLSFKISKLETNVAIFGLSIFVFGVYVVGCLDCDSEGLLVLMNDDVL